MSEAYDGKQIVGMDLHRRRSVLVRMTEAGERLETVRISNDPEYLRAVMARAGEAPEVVLEATYGWYWAADVLADLGARVHLAHPLGVKGFAYRRVKNDVRDAADLCDLLRMGRLPEAYIATPAEREVRELMRHRALCRYRHKRRYADIRIMPTGQRAAGIVPVPQGGRGRLDRHNFGLHQTSHPRLDRGLRRRGDRDVHGLSETSHQIYLQR